MKLTVVDSPEEVALAAAEEVRRAASLKPDLVLGLPTGRTAVPFYRQLQRLHQAGELDLSRARAFNIDELRLPADHPASFHAFMRRHAGARIGLRPDRWEIPDGTAEAEAECRRYEKTLAAAGGLDLAVLGVGADGHVAYNLPGQVEPRTHVVELSETLADRLGVEARWRPLRAITMGMETLGDARRLALMATGATKAGAIRALVEGPAAAEWPCSLLREHKAFEIWVDRPAAMRLRGARAR